MGGPGAERGLFNVLWVWWSNLHHYISWQLNKNPGLLLNWCRRGQDFILTTSRLANYYKQLDGCSQGLEELNCTFSCCGQWCDMWPLCPSDTADHSCLYRATVIGPSTMWSLWPISKQLSLMEFIHDSMLYYCDLLQWSHGTGPITAALYHVIAVANHNSKQKIMNEIHLWQLKYFFTVIITVTITVQKKNHNHHSRVVQCHHGENALLWWEYVK